MSASPASIGATARGSGDWAVVDAGLSTQADSPHNSTPQLAQQVEAADLFDAAPRIDDRSRLAQLLEAPAVVQLAVDDERIAGRRFIRDHRLVMSLKRHAERQIVQP